MGIGIKYAALSVAHQKALVLALAVHVYQALRKNPEILSGEELSLDMYQRPSAVGLDRAPDVEDAVLRLHAALGKPRQYLMSVRHGDHGIDDYLVGAASYGTGIGLLAHQKTEGAEDYRLSGSGFSRYDVEALREIDTEVLYQCEVPDFQMLKH